MISFENDYSEGTAKEILEELIKENEVQASGYSVDKYCLNAQKLIRKHLKNDNVDVHFIPGGTPCNLLVASLLKDYESMICASSGHINTHETGAVESTGHKCIVTTSKDGKLYPKDILDVLDKYQDEHFTKPTLVYISNSTEIGTIYNKKELVDLSKVCKKNNLILYLDGARLASALTAKTNDLTMADICKYTDIFYIGGTKNGALLGEALVIKDEALKKNFRYLLKNRGMMLAKGRTMGITFSRLFKDDLYYDLARHANKMALKLKKCFKETKTKFYCESYTNQQFIILENNKIKQLKKKYKFNLTDKIDTNHTVARFVTSWCTKEENVNKFIEDYKKIA